MNAILFDTLKLVRTLRDKAKFSPEQAEGLADAMAEAMQGDIATKADVESVRVAVDALRGSTKADMDALRASTKADTESVRGAIDALRASTKADIEALRVSTKADTESVRSAIDALRASTKADSDALRVSTKADIDALRASTKTDIDALRASTKTDIAELKADLLKWIVGAIGFQTIVILGAAFALARAIRP